MGMLHDRSRVAVKRSTHFVLPKEFQTSVKGVAKGLARDFWSFIDNKTIGKDVLKRLRDAVFTVWGNGGINTYSVPFAQSTMLVIDKIGNTIHLRLKEPGGKLTDLNSVDTQPPFAEDIYDSTNTKDFNRYYNNLVAADRKYPSKKRPITAAITEAISDKYAAPLPICVVAIQNTFSPSMLSNGFYEQTTKNMIKEVFEEEVVNDAISADEVERLDHWRFKVRKNKYPDWRARVSLPYSVNPRTERDPNLSSLGENNEAAGSTEDNGSGQDRV